MAHKITLACFLLAGFMLGLRPLTAQEVRFETRSAIQYVTHDGAALAGDLFLPEEGNRAAIVAVHGGGWQTGSRDFYRSLGPFLASHGYVVFSADYRLARDGKNRFPAAVHDVRAAVQWVRARSGELKIDPARIALMGDSAGAQLSALVALAGDSPECASAYAGDPDAGLSTKVKAVVGIYGIYDMIAQWEHDLVPRPTDNIAQNFMGFPPMQDRRAWYSASPIAHATFANNGTSFLLVHGTADDIVDPRQSEAFLTALKQARFYARAVVINSAPHFWISDPVAEPNGFNQFLAPRLLRFLAQRL